MELQDSEYDGHVSTEDILPLEDNVCIVDIQLEAGKGASLGRSSVARSAILRELIDYELGVCMRFLNKREMIHNGSFQSLSTNSRNQGKIKGFALLLQIIPMIRKFKKDCRTWAEDARVPKAPGTFWDVFEDIKKDTRTKPLGARSSRQSQ